MTRRQEAALLRRSCGGDFRAYCQGVELGEGRALRCLMQNESRLSPACKSGLAAARQGK
jgi:cysteine rich repeat protein